MNPMPPRQPLLFCADEHLSDSELNNRLEQSDFPVAWNLSFARAQSSEEHRPILFSVRRGTETEVLALAMFRHSRVRAHLLMPSFPRFLPGATADAGEAFWSGIRDYCGKHNLVRVSVNSYEALKPEHPGLKDMVWSRPRSEYYIDLRPELDDILRGFSSNHRRNIRKAQKHNLKCTIHRTEDALLEHLTAFSHTAARREGRRESIPGVNENLLRKLLNFDSAFLMQLHRDENIISSMYIITTPKRAFYFSGGTTPEGTKIGAFQYLVWCAIGELRNRGISTLTLGGTDSNTPEGLRRFKLGFNAEEVSLMHYEFLEGIAPLKFAYRVWRGVKS